MNATRVVPSVSALLLFEQMSSRSDEGVLSISDSLMLAIERRREDMSNGDELHELLTASYVLPHPDGGWVINQPEEVTIA